MKPGLSQRLSLAPQITAVSAGVAFIVAITLQGDDIVRIMKAQMEHAAKTTAASARGMTRILTEMLEGVARFKL